MHRTAFIATLLLAGAANANLIVNGGFEDMPNWNNGIGGDGAYTLFVGNSIPGWTIASGRGATIHNTNVYPTISGTYSLNTDGEGFNGHNVDIYQDFASANGQAYALTFDWKNWFSDGVVRLDVSIVDQVSNNVLAQGNYGLDPGNHNETLSFAGSGNTLRLRVTCNPESGYNDNTFIVDNFAVEAIPAPGAVAALSIGSVFAMRRRRHA
ncbi:MAG: DUF642 domain-containing protein [Phycisphaerales bacterium]